MKLQQTIQTGQNASDEDISIYMTEEVKYDLHVIDGIIYRGKRIVVPETLQRRVIELGHEGHQGVSKTKSFIRQFCWFPGLDAKVERQTKECLACQTTQPSRHHEPIKASELPKGPWQFVEMDFQGPYPNGEYIFVMIDRYSHWPEIAFFRNPPTAKTTINVMQTIFADKGIPAVCQSDNGQSFQSADIKAFASKQGFMLKHITPEWPRANGTVERFKRCLKEDIQAGHVEGKSMRESATAFLQSYRASPHTTTKKSPFVAMHGGREMRTKLPMEMYFDDVIDREQVEGTKAKMISRDASAKEHRLKVGDRVVVMQKKKNKLSTVFDPTPLTVTSIKGSMITANKKDWAITRDASKFRKLYGTLPTTSTKRGGEEIQESENDSTEQSDLDEQDQGEIDHEVADIGQDDEGAHGANPEPHIARPERARQPPAWLRDYET